MQIESKIKREGGTHVTLGATNYHFAPLADGAHVADVENESHQDRLLGISEGFKLYRGAEYAAPVGTDLPVKHNYVAPKEPVPALSAALVESAEHDQQYTIHGNDISLAKITELAFEESRMSVELWNEQEPVVIADRTDQMLDKLDERLKPAPTTAAPTPADERAELAKQYEQKFAKKPHHKWGAAKIRQELES